MKEVHLETETMRTRATHGMPTEEHDSVTYFFCGKGCLLDFRDDPDKSPDPAYSPSM
jgi:hypothetical protein